jgi:hypothetical protein
MTFSLKYQDVVRKPNPMVTINPLKNPKSKVVSLEDRVKTLEMSTDWKKTIKEWTAALKTFDVGRLPKVSNEKLGILWIREDIQRLLDSKHCATIALLGSFDPALLQCIQCIKTSDGKFVCIDSQHTATVIASLIAAGMMEGVSDWKEFEFPFQYIETDSISFARRAFSTLNGKGKKKQSAYQQLRNSVYIVRLDGDTSDPDEVDLERKVSIAETYECFPVEVNSTKYPGTFSNIATFKTLKDSEIDIACKWHNMYFHYEPVHVSLFFIFKDICREFSSAKLMLTDKLLTELAALIQGLFANLSQFQTSVSEAHTGWTTKRYGYQASWDDDAYACALLQLYKKFGGEEKIAPTLLDRFDGLIDFLDQDIIDLAG